MKKWFKKPSNFDTKWMDFVRGKFEKIKPDTSHHIAFQMGYLSGRENQQYIDLRTIVAVFECLGHSDNQFVNKARSEFLDAILMVVKDQKLVDKYTVGLKV